jgi:quercetin dioxygenase-like cupin family protein
MRKGTRRTITTGHPERKGKNAAVSIEWLVPYARAKLLSASIHMIGAGGGSHGAISHKGEEMGYVLKGRFEIEVSRKTFLLDPGDSFFFPSEMPHGYRNPGDTETWVLWVNTPPTF